MALASRRRDQGGSLPVGLALAQRLLLTAGLGLLCGGAAPGHHHRALALALEQGAGGTLSWEERAAFPGGGRHHPITFANETHGFVLSGSTQTETYTSDFWAYEAATDKWTNLTGTDAAFPGAPRSFGYGVASTMDCGNTKAYVGLGAGENYQRFTDFWEFDMVTHAWRELASFPGLGRRHPAMNFIEPVGEIHVGLGDGLLGNYKDYWAYSIETDEWRQLEDFPSSERHHPFYFAIDANSYLGLGHSNGYDPFIERDWYRYDAIDGTWEREEDFASYPLGIPGAPGPGATPRSGASPVTTEARVAGTQFSVAGSCDADLALGFVLSGDGDDHSAMPTGEFHVFDPSSSEWHELPPHPGSSRWAPGSFVVRGTTRAYLVGGYDRNERILYSDLWTIDLEPLFVGANATGTFADVGLDDVDYGYKSLQPSEPERLETEYGYGFAGPSSPAVATGGAREWSLSCGLAVSSSLLLLLWAPLA